MAQNQHNTSSRKSKQLYMLLSQIEEKLNWGPSGDWKGVDFERLSDLIFEQTNQRLSITTLKRTWGRTSQIVKPSSTTLDILAVFVGAKNWRDFIKSGEQQNINMDFDEPSQGSQLNYLTYGSGLIVVGILALFMSYNPISLDINDVINRNSDISLDIQKVTSGIPNTVVFKYNVGNLKVDTLELQQSWDERKRILLDARDSIVTSTYFSPGYFNAKLVADGKIVIQKDLYIPSNGLQVLAFLNDEVNPRLLPSDYWSIYGDELQFESTYEDSFEGRKKNNLLISNLLQEPKIDADTFAFTYSFLLSNNNEGEPCHPISVIITGTEDVYMFELGHPGCSGKFSTYLGGDFVSGGNKDLSFMGFLEGEWVDFDLSKKGSNVTLAINGSEVLLSHEANSIGRVGGVRIYTSQKMGIRQLELQDDNRVMDLLKHNTSSDTD